MHAFPLSLDVALNLLWLAIGAGGLAFAATGEFGQTRSRALRRVLAVFVMMLALFPSVSVSDDEISFWFLTKHAPPRGGMGVPAEEKERATQTLARLLDVIENFQLPGTVALVITVIFLGLISFVRQSGTERFLVHRTGRAPPVF